MAWDKTQLPDLLEREEAAKLLEASIAAEEAYAKAEEAGATDDDLDLLNDAIEAATEAYNEHPGALRYTENGVTRCAISGVPLWAGDETLDCPWRAEDSVLRAAVGLPPLTPEDKGMGASDDEDETEEAPNAAF